jgi:hypothetical protein
MILNFVRNFSFFINKKLNKKPFAVEQSKRDAVESSEHTKTFTL